MAIRATDVKYHLREENLYHHFSGFVHWNHTTAKRPMRNNFIYLRAFFLLYISCPQRNSAFTVSGPYLTQYLSTSQTPSSA